MPPTAAITDTPIKQEPRYKMRLLGPEYLEEFGGKLPAGSIVICDQGTAARWLENGIAEQAGRGEKTAKEIKRAETLARLRAIDDDELDDGIQETGVKRHPMAGARVPRRRNAKLDAAGAINGPSADPPADDEITVDLDDED